MCLEQGEGDLGGSSGNVGPLRGDGSSARRECCGEEGEFGHGGQIGPWCGESDGGSDAN